MCEKFRGNKKSETSTAYQFKWFLAAAIVVITSNMVLVGGFGEDSSGFIWISMNLHPKLCIT
jgi:hypothetical protein